MANCKIMQKDNKPILTVDGHTVPPVLYGLSDIPGSNSNTAQAQKNIAAFHEAGIDLVNVDTGLYLGWHKATPFDADAILSEIGSALEANPHARVLVRLHVNPPYWWLRDHPEECVIYRTKTGDVPGIDNGESHRLIADDFSRHMRVSLASERWLEETSEKLVLLCEALSGTPEGEALLGIQIACGGYGEWHQWGTDVSFPMKRNFIAFLKQKYKTEQGLREAWHDPEVTFETAEFHPETWQPADEGMFRDPRHSRHIMDAQQSIQSTVPRAILRFCRVIKQKLPGVLAGAFYSYYLGCGANTVISGHLHPEDLYAEKSSIDFLCGPFCYLENRKAEAIPMQRSLLESHRLRGMLWLTEMDQHPESVDYLGGDIRFKDSTIATLRRNVLQPLLAGQGLWYYDHRVIPQFVAERPELARAASIYRKRGWWEKDYLMNEIGSLQRIAEQLTAVPYEPAADVLLVYDPLSFYCRAKITKNEYALHEAVARTGAAYDCIYMSELSLAELDRYKCVIMVDCYCLTPEKREQIRRVLKDKTTLWLYASGYCDGDCLSTKNLSETVGIVIEKAEFQEGSEQVDEYSPVFVAVDELAIPLAFYRNGAVSAAQKGTDIWLGSPKVTEDMMRNIFASCGVHRYTDSHDPIMAGGGLVAINTTHGGDILLTLKNGKQRTLSLSPYTTAVLDAESGERLL